MRTTWRSIAWVSGSNGQLLTHSRHLGTTTLGQLIFFLFWHETYDVGQPEYLRQLAGTDDKVI